MFVDRGMKNDMEKLRKICSFCYWNGGFKEYQVKCRFMSDILLHTFCLGTFD